MAKLGLLVSLGLLAAACSRSAMTAHDAGKPGDGSRAGADAIGGPEAQGADLPVAPADLMPDQGADVLFLADASLERPSDLADDGTRDLADATSDPVRVDVAADTSPRDGPSDRVVRDELAVERPRDTNAAETASPDVTDGAREAAADLRVVAIDGGLAGFCTGEVAHMLVNGVESYPAVTGAQIPLDCCDAGQVQAPSDVPSLSPIVVAWRRTSFAYPTSVDLAALPSSWTVRVVAGCDPVMSSCGSPGDTYATGLEGTLSLDHVGTAVDVSVCVRVREPAGATHALLHSLDFYAPHVKAP